MPKTNFKELTKKQADELLEILAKRFQKNSHLHKGIEWPKVEERLHQKPEKLWSLNEMEKSGGEPDVVSLEEKSGSVLFFDCSPESPAGRRSLCYDRQAWESRKENKPKNNVIDFAAAMGIEILNEQQYRFLQELGNFDTKTSSWILTPQEIRTLNGALFCDRRYNHVFTYHNGAESYYAARGFRGMLRI